MIFQVNFHYFKIMKIKLLSLLIILSAIGVSAQKMNHFTEKDRNNWIFVLNNKSAKATDLFIFDNGVLKITDAAAGYLRTKKIFKNFILEAEWRWTKVAANSGVLVHIQKQDTVWPVCYQVQQKANAAGDIICMNGLKARECTDSIKFTVAKMLPSNEKPLGEWNHIRVISKNGTLTVYVNDILQNKISGLSVKKGYIGFQAEGKPMEFRNLTIR